MRHLALLCALGLAGAAPAAAAVSPQSSSLSSSSLSSSTPGLGGCEGFAAVLAGAAPRGRELAGGGAHGGPGACAARVPAAHVARCEAAVREHGWAGVAAVARGVPRAVCGGDVLLSGGADVEGELFANLADAAVTGSEDIADDADADADAEAAAPAATLTSRREVTIRKKVINNPPPSALSTVAQQIMEMTLQRQLLASQQAQQTQMSLQMIKMKILAIMDSNRQIKQRMRTMRRHSPGNCDCCQACRPQKPVGA
jgi:hypothetical protein